MKFAPLKPFLVFQHVFERTHADDSADRCCVDWYLHEFRNCTHTLRKVFDQIFVVHPENVRVVSMRIPADQPVSKAQCAAGFHHWRSSHLQAISLVEIDVDAEESWKEFYLKKIDDRAEIFHLFF